MMLAKAVAGKRLSDQTHAAVTGAHSSTADGAYTDVRSWIT